MQCSRSATGAFGPQWSFHITRRPAGSWLTAVYTARRLDRGAPHESRRMRRCAAARSTSTWDSLCCSPCRCSVACGLKTGARAAGCAGVSVSEVRAIESTAALAFSNHLILKRTRDTLRRYPTLERTREHATYHIHTIHALCAYQIPITAGRPYSDGSFRALHAADTCSSRFCVLGSSTYWHSHDIRR